jgi:calcineurin-like phosphoesterase family protein
MPPREFVIGDTHFHCRNLIATQSRPEDNDELIIANWRRIVAPEDVVYHLGDLAYGTNASVKDVAPELTGRKVLVLGNHDRRSPDFYRGLGFFVVVTQARLPLDQRLEGLPSERELILTHEPLRKVWPGRVNIHGHTHFTEMQSEVPGDPYINVSADATQFCPVNMKEIRRRAVDILAQRSVIEQMEIIATPEGPGEWNSLGR